MTAVLNIIFIILIFISVFLAFDIIFEKKISVKVKSYINEKSKNYYNDISKKRLLKQRKYKLISNSFFKISNLIEKANLRHSFMINPTTIVVLSIVSFVFCFIITRNIFKIILLSLIISLPSFLIPVVVLKILAQNRNDAVERGILDFILQLRNLTRINNDIVYAFKQVKTINPLQGYIDDFLIEVNNGIKFEDAIESLQSKVTFGKLKELFENIEYCYIYGGDYQELMRKSYVMISKVQQEKRERKNETRSARIVLGILIFLDLFVYFNYIKNNYENYSLMTKQLLGQIILYWNFISIWLLIFLMNRVQKLDY